MAKNGTLFISYETIYKYVLWDKSLRQSSKKRRKRYQANDSRDRLAGKRHISERPGYIDEPKRIGDWEINTVMGAGDKHCVVSVVERKTGYTLIG